MGNLERAKNITTMEKLVQGTAVNASGTSVDFTGIPSWTKRITVMFDGVSTNGSSILALRIGTAGGIEISGYRSGAFNGVSSAQTYSSTTEFILGVSNNSTLSANRNGSLQLSNMNNNTWCMQGVLHEPTYTVGNVVSGSKTLSATLDRIRITTVNGTDTFDAGQINILVEG